MDIISHALAGAATGTAFGRPFTGALLAVIPDLPIMGPRRQEPPLLYEVCHSLWFVVLASCIGALSGNGLLVLCCIGSHLVLDIPTHGPKWAPKLLWPNRVIYYTCEEWEFFNRSWFVGASITLLWCFLWLTLS